MQREPVAFVAMALAWEANVKCISQVTPTQDFQGFIQGMMPLQIVAAGWY
jgi:hypothetical protein